MRRDDSNRQRERKGRGRRSEKRRKYVLSMRAEKETLMRVEPVEIPPMIPLLTNSTSSDNEGARRRGRERDRH